MSVEFRLGLDVTTEELSRELIGIDPEGAWQVIAKQFEATLPKWRADLFSWLKGGVSSLGTEVRSGHLSLFSDQEHDGRIFARKTRNHDESKVLEVFNQFFAAVVLYDLTRQWVLQNGPFASDYSWLVFPRQEEFNEKISAVFQKHYGARLETFIVLQPPAVPRV